jgi:hypothetical protein
MRLRTTAFHESFAPSPVIAIPRRPHNAEGGVGEVRLRKRVITLLARARPLRVAPVESVVEGRWRVLKAHRR